MTGGVGGSGWHSGQCPTGRAPRPAPGPGLIGSTIDHARRLVEFYRTAGAQAGHPEEALQEDITSHFYLGDTAEQAYEQSYPYYERYPRYLLHSSS